MRSRHSCASCARLRRPGMRIPALRAGARPPGDVPLRHAPRPLDTERIDGVPRRPVDRGATRARSRRGLAELRRLRTPDARSSERRRVAAGPPRRALQPLLPDREPLQLQRQVLASLGAAVPRLRSGPAPAARGSGGNVDRGPAAQAGVALAERGLGLAVPVLDPALAADEDVVSLVARPDADL